MDTQIVPKKDVEVIKKQLTTAERFANELVIKSREDYDAALKQGISIKAHLDAVTEQKDKIVKPAYAAYKAASDFFKIFETGFSSPLKIIRDKMTAWKDEQDRIAEEKARKIEVKVEAGKMKESTAGIKLAEIKKENAATVVTDAGSATTKKVPKYRLVDLKLIPAEFLKPDLAVSDLCDMKKVKASFDLEKPVAGIEKYYESQTSFN